jgi:hypothetical protein
MKEKFGILLFLAGFLFPLSFKTAAQTTWLTGVKVINKVTFDPTCTNGLNAPCVIKDSGLYKMWYTREIGTGASKFNMIGFATSSDGMSWTLIDTAVIYPAETTVIFDKDDAGQCSVIRDGDTLYMWYWGQDDKGSIGAIGYAKSIDGRHWTKVPGSGVEGSIFSGPVQDSLALLSPYVLKDGSTYKMWHTGMHFDFANGNITFRMCYATSPDRKNWTKVNGSGKYNSIIDLGATGKFDESWVFFPCVLKTVNGFEMWYSGKDTIPKPNLGNNAIGYATSTDGISWTRFNGSGPKGSLFAGGTPSVIKEGNTYKMWYSGQGGIYYTTSTVTAINESNLKQSNIGLERVYPNPFNSKINIDYNVATNSHVTLKIFDVVGNQVAELVNQVMEPEHYSLTYIAENLCPGVYWCQFTSGSKSDVMKLLFVQ